MMLEMNAALALYPHNVVSSEVVNSLPRWGLKDQTYFFPQSHLLRTDIREPLRDIEPDDGRFTNAFDRLELLVGLVCLAAPRKYKQVWWGEVGLGNRWNYGASDELRHEGLARVLQGTSDPNWTFLATAGVTSTEEATQLGVELTTHLEQMREKGRWG